ncbi:MAG TPA: MqnA/MqnD/SBP family protein, partial [Thermoanaerobaculia bacterium]|nr:MqnA/MqnD/SBP family protein [Thermoanaerobaculia bacterium]
MNLRFSVVDFLNARPLIWGLLENPPPGVHVSRDLPSVCADKLASGEADVGLIPSIEYQRISDLRVVRGLGIAAASEVRSVLLVSRVPRERIRSLSLDPASRTSAVLTRLLLKRQYGIEPI